MNRAAIVILNYNTQHQLQQFLPQLVSTNETIGWPIYVIDNASSDDSVDFLKTHYPTVTCIELPKNYGFAEGYNKGLQQINATHFVLLNSDIQADVNSFPEIIEFLEAHPLVAACQPKILSFQQPDSFEYAGAAGGHLDVLGYPFCKGRIFDSTEKDEGQYNQNEPIFWASGAAFFIKADLFKAFGGFDGTYFAHAEEIDLCWRLKRAGYQIFSYPKVAVYHVGGGTLAYSSPFKTYLNFRNTLATLFKNEKSSVLIPKIFARLLLDGAAGVLFLFQSNFKGILAIIHAHWHFFMHLPHHIRTRKRTNELVSKQVIGPSTTDQGYLKKSIVWQFYLLRKKKFSQLL